MRAMNYGLAAGLFAGVGALAQVAAPAACGVPVTAHTVSYLNDSFGKIRDTVTDLKGVKFEGGKTDDSAAILEKTGAAIATMVPRIPNLIAEEQLSQVSVGLPYAGGGENRYESSGSRPSGRYAPPSVEAAGPGRQLEGEDLQKALEDLMTKSAKHNVFSYRIRADHDPALGITLEEFRTTSENEAVSLSDMSPGNPRGVGYSTTWLQFMPKMQPQMQYRYLGRQKVGTHETYVVAFAQIPEKVTTPSEIRAGEVACPYYTQGVAWIDQGASQIVKMETDLLARLSGLEVTRLRSKLHFSEVRIEERNLVLWLPSDVEIVWMAKNSAGGELHRYSHYRLFGATSKIRTDVVE